MTKQQTEELLESMLDALSAIVEAGRLSESSRAVYCADIARAALARAEQ